MSRAEQRREARQFLKDIQYANTKFDPSIVKYRGHSSDSAYVNGRRVRPPFTPEQLMERAVEHRFLISDAHLMTKRMNLLRSSLGFT